ncbi:tetratricopeptide repeat protein [Aggregatimonas sangjinii]|uniref:Tetratricopeptide repeat protein n=1 Tax=Aggregatimonas sangjinii TaxID=2583587 RepID=A0A5B7SVV7_9FLAO|nr:tetratricopeptide repeat protein [Aggregatimonas sangjinii]QCX01439.1 tetratricopeptide repeat protein [Aggregatimonas sangjinii]
MSRNKMIYILLTIGGLVALGVTLSVQYLSDKNSEQDKTDIIDEGIKNKKEILKAVSGLKNEIELKALEAYIKNSNSSDFDILEETGFSKEQLYEIAKNAIKESKSSYIKGLGAFTLKKYNDAVELFEKAKSYNKLNPDIYFYLGTSYLNLYIHKSNLATSSEVFIKEDLNLAEQTLDIQLLKNNVLSNYDRALKLNENLSYVYYNKSIVFYLLGNHTESLTNIEKAIAITPNGSYINQKGAVLSDFGLVSNDPFYHHKAIKEFQKAIALNPKKANRHINLGLCYTRLRDYDSGILHYERALKLDPNSSLAYLNLGALYAEKGLYDESVNSISKAIVLNKNNSYNYLLRSKLYTAMNKNHLAAKDLQKYRELKKSMDSE